jgi:alginate O-acetyltransferase complex protein AlgI
MLFYEHMFLFYFLPLVLLTYYGLLKAKVSLSWINLLITIASYIFYGWFEPWFVTLMWVSTIVDYACGRAITWPEKVSKRANITVREIMGEISSLNIFYPFFVCVGLLYSVLVPSEEKRRILVRNTGLVLSMVVNLGLLGFFKYYMFVMGGMNRLAEILGGGSNFFHILNITMPIGISFYTFQTMSYTIDVWRGDAPVVKDMRTFSCFVALFPQLIAGPIIRYNTVAEQLSYRKHTLEMFTSGVAIFILGLSKKVLLADRAALVCDAVFGSDAPGTATAWWGILAYHFQIYFDFCAYSDMAVGLGRMMGFEFIKNFNAPYHSDSISSFWNRWHISLSTWIRDYLYIGLGGNRKGVGRTYINLALSMFLCGVWHGAKMTFVTWGVYNGVLLIWERTMGRQPLYRGLPRVVRIIITNVIVMFGWVIFRTPSLEQGVRYWGLMVGAVKPAASAALLHAELFNTQHVFDMLLCAVLCWQPIQAYEWVKKLTPVKYLFLAVLLFISIISMFTSTYSPFLYFQF